MMNKIIKILTAVILAIPMISSASQKASVEIKVLPDYHIAYVEYKGDFEANDKIYDDLLEKLLAWAVPKNLFDFPGKTKMLLIYPDNPATTPKNERRLFFGITVPKKTQIPDGIKSMTIPGGTYAVGSFEISSDEFGNSWGYMFQWISQSNYYPADGYSYENKKNDSDKHPEKKHIVDICIPVNKK